MSVFRGVIAATVVFVAITAISVDIFFDSYQQKSDLVLTAVPIALSSLAASVLIGFLVHRQYRLDDGKDRQLPRGIKTVGHAVVFAALLTIIARVFIYLALGEESENTFLSSYLWPTFLAFFVVSILIQMSRRSHGKD